MTLALCVPAINDIHALRRSKVSFALLWPDRIASQGNLVGLDYPSSVHKFHRVRFLVYDNAISMRESEGW